MDSLIDIQSVSRKYLDGKVLALDHVSLQIARGEFLAVTGRSGCGKSTLLNLIGGLDRPSEGEILFEGKQLSTDRSLDRWRSEKIGFVFQSFCLLPNLTAEENVQLPLFGRSTSDRFRVEQARRFLDFVGLADRRNHLPSELSIGQCQRVALARALVNRPALLLADEPTGSLDSQSGEEVLELLESCRNQEGMTIVMVTHDRELASRAARLIRLQDGRIVEDSHSASPKVFDAGK
jgi:putative ABC transport system ATP-binding protein